MRACGSAPKLPFCVAAWPASELMTAKPLASAPPSRAGAVGEAGGRHDVAVDAAVAW
jgi:hypothetical protein